MIVCPSCGACNLKGALVCDGCGAELMGAGDHIPAGPMVVRFRLVDGGDGAVEARLTEELSIGRSDAGGSPPDIDLAGWGGADAGVSRRHALARLGRAGVELEDVGSTNGTWVDGRRITPYRPHRLQSGDQVSFGALAVRVEIAELTPRTQAAGASSDG